MTKNQHRQFLRWLNEFANGREQYNNSGGRPTAIEMREARREGSRRMAHAQEKLVQLFNSREVK